MQHRKKKLWWALKPEHDHDVWLLCKHSQQHEERETKNSFSCRSVRFSVSIFIRLLLPRDFAHCFKVNFIFVFLGFLRSFASHFYSPFNGTSCVGFLILFVDRQRFLVTAEYALTLCNWRWVLMNLMLKWIGLRLEEKDFFREAVWWLLSSF